MEIEMIKENIVQEKSYNFAIEIIQLIKKFPRKNDGFVLGKQLLRSSTSIGANVEEAIGAFSKSDFIYKMSIALKEAREKHYWLRLIRDSNMLNQNAEAYVLKAEELIKILTAIVKRSKNQN
ncbi:MAG: four helix bundle protein [Calditrichaceae bacterium]|jgi:four helix bundle protein